VIEFITGFRFRFSQLIKFVIEVIQFITGFRFRQLTNFVIEAIELIMGFRFKFIKQLES